MRSFNAAASDKNGNFFYAVASDKIVLVMRYENFSNGKFNSKNYGKKTLVMKDLMP